ncbi:acyl-CoA dehydrogenase family protein [Streptomyces sp. TR02-1]|uniref:acyl-CoA dehydrogenase family protein n=1 Tax=Streptomyces sp. TR02-1 TaxID=3385977 RepID=UPI0039A1F56E
MTSHFITKRHEDLRAQVRAFAEAEVVPRIPEMEASKEVQHKLARLIAQQGWFGVTIGTGYGGMGAGHLARVLIIEGLSRYSAAAGGIAQASILGDAKILHWANSQQKKKWLPEIAEGRCLPTIAVTEHGSGGHVLGMETTAKRRRGGWVLNGRKCYVGNSHVGDVHGVVVRTGRGNRSRDLSCFLVQADTPGLSLAPHKPAIGMHGFSFGELIFDNCVVPDENLLGEEGDGRDIADSSSVLYGRLNLAAVALGLHRAAYEETVAFCNDRQRYGSDLGDLAVVNARMGEMRHRLETSRTAVYEAAHMLDTGQECDVKLMSAKYGAVQSGIHSAWDAMRTYGAAGLFSNHSIERIWRDLPCIEPPAGTSDVQLHRLGQKSRRTKYEPWSSRLAHLLTAA